MCYFTFYLVRILYIFCTLPSYSPFSLPTYISCPGTKQYQWLLSALCIHMRYLRWINAYSGPLLRLGCQMSIPAFDILTWRSAQVAKALVSAWNSVAKLFKFLDTSKVLWIPKLVPFLVFDPFVYPKWSVLLSINSSLVGIFTLRGRSKKYFYAIASDVF